MIQIIRGDLFEQQTQVAVNPANRAMRGGGGLDGAFHARCGGALLRELEQVTYGVEDGGVVITSAPNLPFERIIHTAGPDYADHSHEESVRLLALTYANALKAVGPDYNSVAFPSISTGIFGFPIKPASRIALTAMLPFSDEGMDIRVVLASDSDYDVYDEALRNLTE